MMEKKMVYCKIKQQKEHSAVYMFGVTTKNITGEVEFYSELKSPTLLKQPNSCEVSQSVLLMLAVKYKNMFTKGEFPEKISYER